MPDAVFPEFISLPAGQIRIFRNARNESAPCIVVLPGMILGAEPRARQVAVQFPDWNVVAVELPGIGGSASLLPVGLKNLASVVSDLVGVLGIEDFMVIAYDLHARLAALLAGSGAAPVRTLGIDMAAARHWAARHASPAIDLRDDGGHLTSMWSFVRKLHILDPADPARVAAEGHALPTAEEMEATVLSYCVEPRSYCALWEICASFQPGATPIEEFASLELAATRAGVDRERLRPLSGNAKAGQQPASGVWRSYVALPRGRVHVRQAGEGSPLIACHSAPGSSEPITRIVSGLAKAHRVIAPDYLGNGESDKPTEQVDIARLAEDIIDLADELDIARFDMFGTHTGALVALETAIRAPERVGRVILEGPPLLDPALTADILANYFQPIEPDRWGTYLHRTWNMRYDMFLFFPWYRAAREAARIGEVPDTRMMHDWTLGLLQSGRTYDRSYRAAWSYDTRARLPLLQTPALLCAGKDDPLISSVEGAVPYCGDNVERRVTPATIWYPGQTEEAIEDTIEIYLEFLRGR